MIKGRPPQPRRVLLTELLWFVKLRWLAGSAVVVGAWIDWRWLKASDWPLGLLAIGASILLYNAVISWWTRHEAQRAAASSSRLNLIAGTEVLLDLSGLTLICLWTGGAASPFIAFFVFHMVFASILLPARMAYGGAVAAAALLGGSLLATTRWPHEFETIFRLAVFFFTLLFTVHLANRLTRALRRQRRKLFRRNRRIQLMSRKLNKQQLALAQHEKMIALGHMAAGVTHEITNPLASMDSLLQLMLRMPQRLNEASVQTLREQISRIHRIVQQMKTFARPADMQSQITPLNDIVVSALEMLRYDTRLRRLQVLNDLTPESPAVKVYPQAMEQVLVNLIQNAIDAMEETAEPRLILRTGAGETACTIEVIDNGHGIRPELMPRVFEPFFTTKPLGRGTGLGLSISYSLIRKQDGTLEAHNVAGGGARFVIRLPRIAPPAAPPGGIAAPSDGSRIREAADNPVSISENPLP